MKKKKNFIVLIAIALLFILAVPVSAASGTMKLNKTRVSMYVTESTTLKALDSRGKTKSASWRSNNTRIATVKNGVITAKKAGTVTITATSNGVKRSCKVTIRSDWYQKVLRSYGASYRVRNNWDGKLTTVYRRNFSRYRLIDINNDGIKELMLHDYPWAVFFTYYKGKVTPLIYGSTRGAYLKGQYLTIKTGTSSENICRTYILQNGKVKQIINYFHTTSSAYPVPIYEVNGKRYSKTAFFKVYNKYMNNAKLLF